MPSLNLSNLVINLSWRIHGHIDKKGETCAIIFKVCCCFLEYTNVKDDLTEYKRLCFKNFQQKFDKKLKEWFFN